MPQFLFDTSAFVKRYHDEPGTARISAVFETPESVFQLSNLGVVEAQAAFAMKVRAREIGGSQAIALRARIMKDIAEDLITVILVGPAHFSIAGRLISKYGFAWRIRTLDALQLAVALDLRAKGLLDVFVVADRVLAELAAREGVTVLNPEV